MQQWRLPPRSSPVDGMQTRAALPSLPCNTRAGQGLDFVEQWLRAVLRREAPHVALRLLPGVRTRARAAPQRRGAWPRRCLPAHRQLLRSVA